MYIFIYRRKESNNILICIDYRTYIESGIKLGSFFNNENYWIKMTQNLEFDN